MYSAGLGRFVHRDPLLFDGSPDGNLYAYTLNNPLNGIDPYGEACCGGKDYIPRRDQDCCGDAKTGTLYNPVLNICCGNKNVYERFAGGNQDAFEACCLPNNKRGVKKQRWQFENYKSPFHCAFDKVTYSSGLFGLGGRLGGSAAAHGMAKAGAAKAAAAIKLGLAAWAGWDFGRLLDALFKCSEERCVLGK